MKGHIRVTTSGAKHTIELVLEDGSVHNIEGLTEINLKIHGGDFARLHFDVSDFELTAVRKARN